MKIVATEKAEQNQAALDPERVRRGRRPGPGLLLAALWLLLHPFAPCPLSAQEKLPLVEVTATGPPQPTLAFMISGDGNWASADRGIATALAAHGVPVVGLEARSYLEHHERTPDGVARDVESVLRSYSAAWGRQGIVLVAIPVAQTCCPSW